MLGEALNKVAEVSDRLQILMMEIYTDTEIGDDQELGEQVMSQVVEVAGKIEVRTSKRSSIVQKPQNKKSKDKMVSVNCLKRNGKKERASVSSTLSNEELSIDDKVDSLFKVQKSLKRTTIGEPQQKIMKTKV